MVGLVCAPLQLRFVIIRKKEKLYSSLGSKPGDQQRDLWRPRETPGDQGDYWRPAETPGDQGDQQRLLC